MTDFPDIKAAIAAQSEDTRELMSVIVVLASPLLGFLAGRHHGSEDFDAYVEDLVNVMASLAATTLANSIPAMKRIEITNKFCTDFVASMQRGKLQ
jgi:hypothetical protein